MRMKQEVCIFQTVYKSHTTDDRWRWMTPFPPPLWAKNSHRQSCCSSGRDKLPMVCIGVEGRLSAVILHAAVAVALPLLAKDCAAAAATHPFSKGHARPIGVVAPCTVAVPASCLTTELLSLLCYHHRRYLYMCMCV